MVNKRIGMMGRDQTIYTLESMPLSHLYKLFERPLGVTTTTTTICYSVESIIIIILAATSSPPTMRLWCAWSATSHVPCAKSSKLLWKAEKSVDAYILIYYDR